jgi:hypothetical protein
MPGATNPDCCSNGVQDGASFLAILLNTKAAMLPCRKRTLLTLAMPWPIPFCLCLSRYDTIWSKRLESVTVASYINRRISFDTRLNEVDWDWDWAWLAMGYVGMSRSSTPFSSCRSARFKSRPMVVKCGCGKVRCDCACEGCADVPELVGRKCQGGTAFGVDCARLSSRRMGRYVACFCIDMQQ